MIESSAPAHGKLADDPTTTARLGWQLVLSCVYRVQPKVFLYSLGCGWVFLICMFLDPLLLNSLLARPEGEADAAGIGTSLVLVLLLSLSMVLRVTCMELCFFSSVRTMNNAGCALIHAIFCSAMAIESEDAVKCAPSPLQPSSSRLPQGFPQPPNQPPILTHSDMAPAASPT